MTYDEALQVIAERDWDLVRYHSEAVRKYDVSVYDDKFLTCQRKYITEETLLFDREALKNAVVECVEKLLEHYESFMGDGI